MDKIKVGIIGCGYMAQMAHIPCLKSIENVELVALCDFRKSVTAELCRRWNIPMQTDSVNKLLAMDIDAVFVLTPVQWHLNNIKAALEAGKKIFTEKPAAMSTVSVSKLKEISASNDNGVTVGYMKRHEANIVELKKIQAKSDWGKMLFIRTHSFIGGHWNAGINDLVDVISSEEMLPFNASPLDPAPAWIQDKRDQKFYSFDNPYYGLLDTGCHSVNLLRHLTGKDPKVQSVRNMSGVKLIDFNFDGTPGMMEFCLNFNMHKWDEVTELYFEKATVKVLTPPPLDMQSSAIVEIYSEDGALHRNIQLEDNRQWAFRLQTEAFIEKVLAGDNSSDLYDAEKDIEIIEKIYKLEKGI
jgi:predicted dehydrogenase